MADPQMIEQDLYEYLAKEDNLRRDEKIRYLKAIFQKHQDMDALVHVISPGDLYQIVSTAKDRAATAPHTLVISGKEMAGHNPIHIQMVETIIGYLNRHSLLKRVVGFEYNK